jgi:hypothetical protein
MRSTSLLLGTLAMGVALSATAAGPSSANYAIPSSAINAGVGPMSSTNFKLSSSLGDPVFGGTSTSSNYAATPGLWPEIKGVGPACILDLDGNGNIDALTDGLMLLRYMFGLTGASVTNSAIGSGATRTTFAQIQPIIQLGLLDIDGNGTPDALTDGLMIIRAMFGLTGNAVTNNAIGPGATRANWTAIRSYLNATCGTVFAP